MTQDVIQRKVAVGEKVGSYLLTTYGGDVFPLVIQGGSLGSQYGKPTFDSDVDLSVISSVDGFYDRERFVNWPEIGATNLQYLITGRRLIPAEQLAHINPADLRNVDVFNLDEETVNVAFRRYSRLSKHRESAKQTASDDRLHTMDRLMEAGLYRPLYDRYGVHETVKSLAQKLFEELREQLILSSLETAMQKHEISPFEAIDPAIVAWASARGFPVPSNLHLIRMYRTSPEKRVSKSFTGLLETLDSQLPYILLSLTRDRNPENLDKELLKGLIGTAYVYAGVSGVGLPQSLDRLKKYAEINWKGHLKSDFNG